MESSSSILSPIFLAEHHSLEYLSMSLFRFLNSWKVWKEKKREEYQFLAAVSPWRVPSRAKWGNNNTSREGKHVISNLSNLLVSITKILQRSWYRWKTLMIITLITGKENIQTAKVQLLKKTRFSTCCWLSSVVGYFSHQTFIEKRSTGPITWMSNSFLFCGALLSYMPFYCTNYYDHNVT